MKKNYYILVLTALFAICGFIQASVPFTEGNIVVYRLGDGPEGRTFDLSVSNSAPIFLDEYAFDEDGLLELIQSVALPETTVGNNFSCVGVPSGHQMGLISRSQCGRYIVIGGYEAALASSGTHIYQSSWGVVASSRRRVIARVDVDGNVNTTTALTDAYSKKDLRGVTSYDGTQFWMSGDNDSGSGDGLTRYTTLGATSSIKINDLTGRALLVHKGQLYVSAQERIYRVGEGMPNSVCNRDTLTSPVIDGNGNTDGLALDGASFCFAELEGGKTLAYLASKNGHIKKYSVQEDGTYKYENDYLLTDRGFTPTNARGLICKVDGNDVNLYFTTSADKNADGGGGGVYWFVDKGGHNAQFYVEGDPICLVPARDKTTIRGMAWAPVRESQLSSNKNIVLEKVSVYTEGNLIKVTAEKEAVIEVYNLLGAKVVTLNAVPGGTIEISGLTPSQMYVVKVGNTVKKVLL